MKRGNTTVTALHEPRRIRPKSPDYGIPTPLALQPADMIT